MNTELLNQACKLSVVERIELAEAIWESVAGADTGPKLSAAQSEELDRRMDEHRQRPDDVVSWSEVKAQALARLRR